MSGGTRPTREEWAAERIEARIWWCGDETCDCTQPQIERVTPGERYPWVCREVVWEGEFLTGTEGYTFEERDRLQFGPLREACARLGVAVPELAR